MTPLALLLAMLAYASPPQTPGSRPSELAREIGQLVGKLADTKLSVEERVGAARKLGGFGEPALPALARFLEQSTEDQAVVALEAVKLVGARAIRLLPTLRGYLSAANVHLRGQSLEILGKLGLAARAALPEVAALHRDRDPQVRRLALVVADRLGEHRDRLAPVLRVALLDEDALVREAASLLAAKYEPARASVEASTDRIAKLVTLFVEDAAARRLAAVALRARGEEALPVFDRLLAAVAERSELTTWAPVALSGAGDRGLARLVARLEAGNGPVDLWLRTIAEIGSGARRASPVLRRFLASPTEATRVAAAVALARVGAKDEQTVRALSRLLVARSATVRVASVAALGALGGDSPVAIRGLVAAVADADRRVRWAAVEALGRLREPGAVGALRAALESDDEHLRWRAVRALGRVGPRARAALPDLRALDDDPSRWVREVLDEAIRDIGG